jgi:hypothetical protein
LPISAAVRTLRPATAAPAAGSSTAHHRAKVGLDGAALAFLCCLLDFQVSKVNDGGRGVKT